jgi:hypothetical protein
LLLLVALLLGLLAWDVWELRALRPPPPEDASFEGFLKAGRRPTSLTLDVAGERLYWTALSARTVAPYSNTPVYEFDRSGRLLNWVPSGDFGKGMMADVPVRKRGSAATVEEARAWLRPVTK